MTSEQQDASLAARLITRCRQILAIACGLALLWLWRGTMPPTWLGGLALFGGSVAIYAAGYEMGSSCHAKGDR